MDEIEDERSDCRTFHVHDRRRGHTDEKRIKFAGLIYSDLKRCIREEFHISTAEEFDVDDTRKEALRHQSNLAGLRNNATLILQNEAGKAYKTPVKQKINIQPHYNTIVKSGQYDYYASEGHDPLPYALAELIDNSLSATVNNIGPRKIEVRLYLDGSSSKNWMVCVLDNGKGMMAKELEDWAVLRRSKFDANREYNRTPMDGPHIPRFLNSDISFFGVGGKQACFFMGESVTVFTKATDSANVCEVTMAKERFEKRVQSGEQVYDEDLIHRQPGDDSDLSSTSNHLMRSLIHEELGKESFTHVVITGTRKENFKTVKREFQPLCMELANIYHYYLHGETGKLSGSIESTSDETASTSTNVQPTVDITISCYNKNGMESSRTKLQDVVQNSESQFITTAADTFEFQIEVPINLEVEADQPFGKEAGIVEGILRYHPFLYTKDTYPGAVDIEPLDGDDSKVGELPARGNQPIFNCYWNGRLIPYTTIKEFDWCSRKKTERTIPPECYSRVSGVLFTNDVFKVSTNKLTFMDLGEKLKDKTTVIFDTKTRGQDKKRGNIESKFRGWLQKCHNEHDKQILFQEPDGHITRNRKTWTRFKSIVWSGQTFGQEKLVRTQDKTNPVHGRITSFLLEGEYNVHEQYSAGGIFELKLEPEMVYQGETAEYALRYLDRTATDEDITRSLAMEEVKFIPTYCIYEWIGNHDMKEGDDGKRTLVSGKRMGEIRAVIRTTDGEDIYKMPSRSKVKGVKWLGVKATLCRIVPALEPTEKPDGATFREVCLIGIDNVHPIKINEKPEQCGYFFENLSITEPSLGDYIVRLEVFMKTPSETKPSCASNELPRVDIPFTIVAGPARHFSIQDIPSSITLGKSFSIKLDLLDDNKRPGSPPENIKPSITVTDEQNRRLDVTYEGINFEDYSLIVHGVTVSGNLGTSKRASSVRGKVTIALPQLMNQTPELKYLTLMPGIPHKIHVPRFQTATYTHTNGGPMKIDVEIKDASDNLTHGAKGLKISCKFTGDADLPSYYATSDSDGKATLTGEKILIKSLRGSKDITAKVYCPEINIASVIGKITIKPREGPCVIKVFSQDGIEMRQDQEITCVAGQEIDSLAFKLFDEAGNEIPLSDKLASKISFFGATTSDTTIFQTGRLPPIRTENTIEVNPKDCHIRLKNTEVEFGFKVRSIPGEPTGIRCSPVGSGELQCGEVLDVLVKIVDEHGNNVVITESPTKEDVTLQTAEGNVMPFEHLEQANMGFIIKDIDYPKVVSSTGSFEGMVQYQDFNATFTARILPGPPHQLVCISHDSNQKLNTHKGVTVEESLIFRLFDEFKNSIFEPANKIEINCSQNLKVISAKASTSPNQRTGEIAFHGLILEDESDEPQQGTNIVNLPNGMHCIWAQLKRTQIKSGLINIEFLPNPDQPHCFDVKFDRQKEYEAGTIMPCVKVTVKAEDGSIMTGLQADRLKAEITDESTDFEEINEEDNMMKLPDASEMQPTELGEGCFIFRHIPVPRTTGTFNMTFLLEVEAGAFRSKQEIIKVHAGQPVKLMPQHDITEGHVSNKDEPKEREVMKAVSFYIMDTHGNITGTDVSGTVVIHIDGGNLDDVPVIDGQSTYTLKNGHADIPNIYLEKGCPGLATTYTLVFTPRLPRSSNGIERFELQFTFHNDVKEREKNARLTQRKSELQKKITSLSKQQNNREMRLKNTKGKLEKAHKEVRVLLNSAGEEFMNLKTVEEVEMEMSRLEQRVNVIKELPSRACTIPVYSTEDPDILGQVAHLAEVQEDREAEVISWHLKPYMEFLVTRTMQKALQLSEFSKGKDGVLALDPSVSADWEKPLPHGNRKRQRGKVPNNIAFAGKLLRFKNHPDEYKQVFTQLLGDTIVVDTLADAISYRKMILPHTSCPTLLTRDGHRLMGNGAFGGSENRCPVDLKGRVFSQPEPSEIHDLRNKIEKLSKADVAFEAVKCAEDELQALTDHEKSQDVRDEVMELDNANKELESINEQLPPEKLSKADVAFEAVKCAENELQALTDHEKSQDVRDEVMELDNANKGLESINEQLPPGTTKRRMRKRKVNNVQPRAKRTRNATAS